MIMMDATYLKAHRIQPTEKAGCSRLIGRTKGGRNTKLHAVCDSKVRPIQMYPSAGQTRDFTGAARLPVVLLAAKVLLADLGHDADWFRNALIDKGITPCSPSKKNRKLHIEHDATLYKQRHKIETMFGRLKAWRRIAMRFDRHADIFLSACALARLRPCRYCDLLPMSPEPRCPWRTDGRLRLRRKPVSLLLAASRRCQSSRATPCRK